MRKEALRKAYDVLDELQTELQKHIGKPICEGCGNCCAVVNIGIDGVEAEFMAEWVKRQPADFQSHIRSICEKWLTDFAPKEQDKPVLVVNGGIGNSLLKLEGVDRVIQETLYLVHKTACPMLENNRCLIHPVRPLVCRTWGVTRVPGNVCHRQPGKHEEGIMRCYITKDHPKMARLHSLADEVGREQNTNGYMSGCLFIPTALMLLVWPQKFYDLLYENAIASAKLSKVAGGSISWQEQVEEAADTERMIAMLVDPFAMAMDMDQQEKTT